MENKRDTAATIEETGGLPGVPTPDQTRSDGMIPDPGTLAKAETSGIIEDRKRTGNLTGM